MSQEMKDVSVYFRRLLELRDVVLLTHRVLQDFPNTILPEFKPWFPSALDSQKPIRPRKPPPLISSSEIPYQIPHEIPPQIAHEIPLQIPHEIPHEIPPQIAHKIPLQIPHEIPNEIPPQIPNEIPPQIAHEIPLQIPPQIPRESSDSRSQSKPVPDPQKFERSWCVISHRSAPLRIPHSFSRPFRRMIEDHGLDPHQRVKWVVCERNCGSLEDLWRDLIRAVRRSRMPSCNANFQRALAQIWLYCDVFYCEYIGNFLKQEFRLSGTITLTFHLDVISVPLNLRETVRDTESHRSPAFPTACERFQSVKPNEKMCGRRSLCVLICVFCFCCALKREPVFSIQELTVTGKDLKKCGNNTCVMSNAKCPTESDVLTATPERFVNTSCHFLSHEESITCRWLQNTSGVRTETTSTFIFRRTDIYCPAIINFYSHFNLTIKSKSVFSQEEWFSDVYPVIIEEIVQAPRPVITSVNVTDSSVNVTWNGGTITKCRIRYKRLNTESWTEKTASQESLFVIEGLQAFSEYHLSVSCDHDDSRWSDWSEETRVKTSESPPSAPLSLSYYVASDVNSGFRQLLLLWKALDVTDARGLIRGYEVSYMPTKQPSLKTTNHTTELKAVVLVMAEEYEVTVRAYNSAGHSPHRRLLIDASRSHDVWSVKALWVYSDGSSLRIRWDRDVTRVNASEFAIGWSAVTDPGHTHWQRVDGSMFIARLTGLKQDEIYNISVFPVYDSLCGPQTSISADLQHGALLDVRGFRVVNVSRSSLVVQWTWKEAKPRVKVIQYKLVLRGEHGTESLSVFPDQHQHSFLQLHPNTRYSVCIHGETETGNFSKACLDVNTPLIDYNELMRFALPVVLLLLVFGIFSVSSMTVCRKYFLPVIANPRFSLIGRWLLNPHLQGNGKICVLKLESVFPFDQQTEKNLIQVEHRVSLISEHEDEIPSQICTTLWKHNSDAHTPSSPLEYVDLPFLADRTGYVQNGQIVSHLSEKTSD
ncbi:unnamed protein product [Leuciscus chuanchicus]